MSIIQQQQVRARLNEGAPGAIKGAYSVTADLTFYTADVDVTIGQGAYLLPNGRVSNVKGASGIFLGIVANQNETLQPVSALLDGISMVITAGTTVPIQKYNLPQYIVYTSGDANPVAIGDAVYSRNADGVLFIHPASPLTDYTDTGTKIIEILVTTSPFNTNGVNAVAQKL